MSIFPSQHNELEDQLREWGRHHQVRSQSASIAFADLTKRKVVQRKRWQKRIAIGVMANAALLLCCLAIFVTQKTPVMNQQAPSIAEIKPEPPQIKIPVPTEIEDSPDKRMTTRPKLVHSKDRLRQRWMEAKRATAQDQVLQRWLAENR